LRLRRESEQALQGDVRAQSLEKIHDQVHILIEFEQRKGLPLEFPPHGRVAHDVQVMEL